MGDPSGPVVVEENGRSNGDMLVMMDEPSSLMGMGPPSPLTGCYLLIVVGEPHMQEHKDIILQRLIKGFLSWNMAENHVDLEEELNTITMHAPEGENARHGERLIQYASENLVTEILIHPQYNTLIQCMRNLLSSFTRHRHIIHAGYTFSGNGSWILQDGTFSVSDFAEAFQEHEVQRVLRAYPDTVSMDIHCDSSSGLWTGLPDKNFAKSCKIRINPVDVLNAGSEQVNAFIDYLAPMVCPANLTDLLESSEVVGNIRFSHPTLYVFPGGQGDAALFGINGFNMLVDGGFNRKACFWDFARHLDRLDAVLMTRVNNSNIQGLSSVIERKQNAYVYPQIGHFFCNIPELKGAASPDGDLAKDSLVVDLIDRGHKMVTNLKSINLKPQTCYRDIEPMNLYHKVGHGTLDMYVISPSRESKEVKEFLHKWTSSDQRLFAAKDTKEFQFPIQNLVSICALLVWQPANPDDSITRILFPGSTPDFKIVEGLQKIKHLEFMKHPICTAKKMVPSISAVTLTKKSLKSVAAEPILAVKAAKQQMSDEKDNHIIDNKTKSAQSDNKAKESKLIEEQEADKKVVNKIKAKKIVASKSESLDEKQQKDHIAEKQDNKDEADKSDEKKDVGSEETNGITAEEPKKDETAKAKPKKPIAETKSAVKSRIDSKPPKSIEKKTKKEVGKSSPTATPKKMTNGTAAVAVAKDRAEPKPKVIARPTRSSPSSTPAKSTKEANNRKVLESKQKAKPIAKTSATKATTEKKETKVERKPISHRTGKGVSPSRRATGSPVKSLKPKTEKDHIIRKAKLDRGGTTDSSLVSTPSADEAAKKIVGGGGVVDVAEADKQRELDELKEEQEAVREIEAVFSREEKSKKKDILPDHREIVKQDSATEAEDEEEYLIIEKEEVEQYTEDSINEPESSLTKEEEMQKHQRDSQESEKKRKTSLEITEEEVEPAADEAAKPSDAEVLEIVEPEHDEDLQPDSIEEAAADAVKQAKDQVHTEVISKDSVKPKSDSRDEAAKTEEDPSSPSPEDKLSSTKRTSDTKDDVEAAGQPEPKDGDAHQLPESQPFSTTIESGATTAPTLPEDERIPLDEIKEDLAVEEKYAMEETKETFATPACSLPKVYEPLERAVPSKMHFDIAHQPAHLRDVVKTPDEVADLPVHEEADIETYEASEEAKDDKKAIEKDAQQRLLSAAVGAVGKVTAATAELPTKTNERRETEDKRTDGAEPSDKISAQPKSDISSDKKVEAVNGVCETDVLGEAPKVEAPADASTEPIGKEKFVKEDKEEDDEDDEENDVEEKEVDEKEQDAEREAIEKAASPHDEVATANVSPVADVMVQSILVDAESLAAPTKSPAETSPVRISPDPTPKPSSISSFLSGIGKKIEDKLTGLKDKVDGTAEKVEYALEDLGKGFETTLKDVTQKSKSKDQVEATQDEKLCEKDSASELDEDGDDEDEIEDEVVHEIDSKDQAKASDDVHDEPATGEDDKMTDNSITKVAETVSKEIDDTVNEAGDKIETAITDVTSKLTSFLDGISSKITAGASEVTQSVDATIKNTTETLEETIEGKAVEEPIVVAKSVGAVTGAAVIVESSLDAIESREGFKEVYDYSHPFGAKSFPTELRETHITTLDSPVATDKDKCVEIKILEKLPEHQDEDQDDEQQQKQQHQKTTYHVEEYPYDRDDLKDIKEEDEEDRYSSSNKSDSRKPSREICELLSDKDTISPNIDGQPPRAVSPREEEVLKIVANVAEVLKSEKDLTEIIPDFSEEELERKLQRASPRPDDESAATVQRMLVTTSSEDGGEEIEICPEGSIKFAGSASPTPSIEALSGKVTPSDIEKPVFDFKEDAQSDHADKTPSASSTPEANTSLVSIEEKDKLEMSEKAQKQNDDEKAEFPAPSHNEVGAFPATAAIDTAPSPSETDAKVFIVDSPELEKSKEIERIKAEMADITSEPVTDVVAFPIDAQESAVIESPEQLKSKLFELKESIAMPDLSDKLNTKSLDESQSRKESVVSDQLDDLDSRRESAISTFSEKDYTKDESSVDDSRPPSAINQNIKTEEAKATSLASAEISKEAQPTKIAVDTKPANENKSPVLSERKSETGDEDSRRESVTSHMSDKSGVEFSRPESIISHFSDRSEPELKEPLGKSPVSDISRPESTDITELTEKEVEKPVTDVVKKPSPVQESEIVSPTLSTASAEVGVETATNDKIEPDVTSQTKSDQQLDDTEASRTSSAGDAIKDDKSRVSSAASGNEIAKDSSCSPADTQIEDVESTVSPSADLAKSRTASAASDKDDIINTRNSSVAEVNEKTQSLSPVETEAGDVEVAEQPESPTAMSNKTGEDKVSPSPSDAISATDDKAVITEKSRTSSVTSEKVEDEKQSKTITPEPSAAIDKAEVDEKSRSPSAAASIVSEKAEGGIQSKTASPEPEVVCDTVEIDIESRVSSAISDEVENDEISRSPSVSPSVPTEKSDGAEKARIDDKSRSASVMSDKVEVDEKSRSASAVPSVSSEKSDSAEKAEIVDKTRSPSAMSDKVEVDEKSRSSSAVPSVSSDHVENEKLSKSPLSVPSVNAEGDDKSRRTSVISDKAEVNDKSRSPSAAPSVASEHAQSRSPSALSDKGDGYKTSADDKREIDKPSQSPILAASISSDPLKSRSPSATPADSNDESKNDTQSRSPSATSAVSNKDIEMSRSPSAEPSTVDDKADNNEQYRTSSAVPSTASDNRGNERTLQSTSTVPSDLSDKAETDEQFRSPSATPSAVSYKTEDVKKSQSPSATQSTASEKSEDEKLSRGPSADSAKAVDLDSSRAPSVASHKSEASALSYKDIEDRPLSVASHKSGENDMSRPASQASGIVEPQHRSRTTSVASEKVEKDSRSPSVASHTSDHVDVSQDKTEVKSRAESVNKIIEDKTSRASSAASVQEKIGLDNETLSPPESKPFGGEKDDEKSRPASRICDDVQETPISKNESAVDDDKTSLPSPSDMNDEIVTSRPASNLSRTSDKDVSAKDSASSESQKPEDINTPRPLSSASHTSDPSAVVASAPIDDTRSQTQSVASCKEDELKKSSRSSSVVGEEPESKVTDKSRSESRQSDVNERDTIDSTPVGSATALDAPRSTSSQSHISEEQKNVEEKEEAAPDSRPASTQKDSADLDHAQTSRPDSVLSHVIVASEVTEVASRPLSSSSHVSNKSEQGAVQISPTPSMLNEKTDAEASSRPISSLSLSSEKQEDVTAKGSGRESIASNVSDKDEKHSPIGSDKGEEPVVSETLAVEASIEMSDCKNSRPASSQSQKIGDVVDDSSTKDTSNRPESVASHKGSCSRPESVASQHDEAIQNLTSRPESALSDTEKVAKDETKSSSSRPESAASNSESITSQKTEPSKISASRPESVTSHIEKEKKDDVFRTGSAASHVDEDIKDSTSRPASVTSQKEEATKDTLFRPESATPQLVSNAESVTSHTDEVSKQAASRPESVASHTDEDAKNIVSRAESVASHKEEVIKDSTSRPESVTSQKDESAVSRPESVVAHTEEKVEDIDALAEPAAAKKDDINKDSISRPESVASDKANSRKGAVSPEEPNVLLVDKKNDDSISRPESVAVCSPEHPEELAKNISSPAESIKDEVSKGSFSVTHSRADSVASHKDEVVKDVISRAESVASHKDSVSRPESVASHEDIAESVASHKDEQHIQSVSRPESVASVTDKDSKEATSRADSVASHKDEVSKDSISRPESATSQKNDAITDEVSRPESTVSPSTKVAEDTITKNDIDEASSRADSVASHKEQVSKDSISRPESVTSQKNDAITDEVSHPESAASPAPKVAADTITKNDIEEVTSRAESVASLKSDVANETTSRPESVVSQKEEEIKDSVSPPQSADNKELDLRSESITSNKDEKTKDSITRPESVTSQKDEAISETVLRPKSATPHPDEVSKSTVSQAENLVQSVSRPESSASHTDRNTKEHGSRSESVASNKDETTNISCSESVTSHKDTMSRPESTASHSEETGKECPAETNGLLQSISRPESAASLTEKDIKDSASEDKSSAPHEDNVAKDSTSRRESTTSQKDQITKEMGSRPESVASHQGEVALKPDSSRPVSVASLVGDIVKDEPKQDTVVKEDTISRPISSLSHSSDKQELVQEAYSASKAKESRPPSVTSAADLSRPASNMSNGAITSRPDSATSNKEDGQKESRSSSVQSETTKTIENQKPAISSPVSSDKAEIVESSRPNSVQSHLSETNAIDQQNVSDEKVQSRPVSSLNEKEVQDISIANDSVSRCESVVSQKIESSRPQSVMSEKQGDTAVDPVTSRPVSNLSDKGADEDKDSVARSGSVASHKEDALQQSRSPSVVSDHLQKAEDENVLETSSNASEKPGDLSRPVSSQSHASDPNKGSSPRPESVTGQIVEESTKESRSASLASHTDDAACRPNEESTSRPQSVADHKVDSGKESRATSIHSGTSGKLDNGLDEAAALSRPASSISHASDQVGLESAKLSESRPASSCSHDDKARSRTESVSSQKQTSGSAVDDKCEHLSYVSDKEVYDKSPSHEAPSRPDSVVSHSSLPHSDSVASHHKDQEAAISRPVSSLSKSSEKSTTSRPASAVSQKDEITKYLKSSSVVTSSNETIEIKSASRPDSSQSHVSDVETMAKDIIHSVSRPESAGSHVSDKEVVKTPSRRESAVVERSSYSFQDTEDEVVLIKDSRSKSVSSIMMTSMYKPDGLEPMATFDEHIEHAKDDLSASRKSSDISSLIEDGKKIDQNLISSKIESYIKKDFEYFSSESPENDRLSTETNVSGKSSPTSDSKGSLKPGTSAADAKRMSTEDLSGRSTPDIAEIDATTKLDITQHFKDQSGMSSPFTQTTNSDSKSIPTSFGLNSAIETPESSPQPTSPFPKGIEALRAEEAKTSSGMTTPDMTRTSTPDLECNRAECLISTTTSSQKSETATSHTHSESSTLTTTTTTTTASRDSKTPEPLSKSEMSSSESQITTKDTLVSHSSANKEISMIKSEFRSYTPASDEYDISSPGAGAGWTGCSDEELAAASPLSTASHAPHSPPSKFSYETDYELQRSSSGVSKKSELDIDDSQDDMPPEYGSKELDAAISVSSSYKADPMATSFYGKLPESQPIPISSVRTIITKQYGDYASSGPDSSSCVSQESSRSADHRFLDEADMDFEKALEEHIQVRGSDVMSSVTSKYAFSPSKEALAASYTNGKEFQLEDIQKVKPATSSTVAKPDEQSTPTTAAQLSSASGASTSTSALSSTTTTTTTTTSQSAAAAAAAVVSESSAEDRVSSWGKPLGLPSPAPYPVDSQTTPKKERKMVLSKTKLNNEKNMRKRSESPSKVGKKSTPIYMDLAYVPHNGNSYYAHVEFFKQVRARYYVFSGTEPSREVYNALLEAKQTWEDKDLEVTIIPTYDTDVLGYWVSENEDLLAKYHIDLSPSASRCTINLQDHETSCSAYRLEF